MSSHVPQGERPPVQADLHPLPLTRLQVDLREPLQLLVGPVDGRLDVAHVDLNYVGARTLTGVGDGDGDCEVRSGAFDRHLVPVEGRVGQSRPEREPGGYTRAVVEPVSDVEPLAVLDLAWLAGEVPICWQLSDVLGDALGESPARLGVAEEHVDRGTTARLPTEPALDYRVDPISPWHVHRSAVAQHHHHRHRRRCQRLDQADLALRQVERRSVEPFRLQHRRQTGEENHDVGSCCHVEGLIELAAARLSGASVEPFGRDHHRVAADPTTQLIDR